jgi:uncharacterized protein (TIGR03435 family)
MKRLGALAWMLLACLAAGQQSIDSKFEVASVKPSPPPTGRGITVGCGGGPGTADPGIIFCKNTNLLALVTVAYRISSEQLSAPEWLESERFDIVARVPRGASKEQTPEMWQHLLAGRFNLTVHHESKVVANYGLVVMKGGAKFREAVEDTASNDAGADSERRPGTMKVDKDGFPQLTSPGMLGMNGHITLYNRKMTMATLSQTISSQVDAPVTDLTDLKGTYEIRLFWLTDRAAPDSVGPTLTQAIRGQLGLNVEPRKSPIDFLVVDHIDKVPTDN